MKKIEYNKKPTKRRSKWVSEFEKMKPGGSFAFKDASAPSVAMAFAYWLAQGKYSIRREGDGYRFYLLKPEED